MKIYPLASLLVFSPFLLGQSTEPATANPTSPVAGSNDAQDQAQNPNGPVAPQDAQDQSINQRSPSAVVNKGPANGSQNQSGQTYPLPGPSTQSAGPIGPGGDATSTPTIKGVSIFCNPQKANSSGLPTILRASIPSNPASDLHLTALQGPAGEFGYFLVSDDIDTHPIFISNGYLCLGGSIGRYNIEGTDMNSLGAFSPHGTFKNASGTSSEGAGFDVPKTLPYVSADMIKSGQTWYFQLWHRDSAINVGDSTFSNGLAFTF